MNNESTSPALDVRDLRVSAGPLEILRGVSFELKPGERLGVVGESGSGKSITALSIMGLLDPPARVTSGSVMLGDTDLLGLSRRDLNRVRGRRLAMIYQDPGSALNPLMTIGNQIVEAIRLHEPVSVAEARLRAADLLGEVGIANPKSRLTDYPHEFSGGMRQRVMIAMALSCNPEVLICDEPTTALDVTTQARVISLIDRVCSERGVAAILITHDMGVAAGFCDSIAVMYAGQLVEKASTEVFYATPRHPYSRALLGATLDLQSPITGQLPVIPGSPPSPQEFDFACSFRHRCSFVRPECAVQSIELRPFMESEVRCIRAEDVEREVVAAASEPVSASAQVPASTPVSEERS
jgi:oligopeptide/dipeptide ABC transporter ATP-binding protein